MKVYPLIGPTKVRKGEEKRKKGEGEGEKRIAFIIQSTTSPKVLWEEKKSPLLYALPRGYYGGSAVAVPRPTPALPPSYPSSPEGLTTSYTKDCVFKARVSRTHRKSLGC